MNSVNSIRFTLTRLLGCLIGGLLAPTIYSASIPDVPLLTSTSAPPNIMMILDDSGSMHWEIMPDDFNIGINTFPRKDSVYGPDDYDQRASTTDDNDPYNALSRSSHVNKVYYNPAVTYQPWSNSDGSLMGNAPSACAPHNPYNSSVGCRDLTKNNTERSNWIGCTSASYCYWAGYDVIKTFWPATYFTYISGDIWTWSSYKRTQIKSTTTSYTGEGRSKRSDCVNAASSTCTYTEEIQNFANWYTYYRSRILTARAGIGRAFASQSTNLRAGFAAINKGSTVVDGVSTKTVISGVRDFSGANRSSFFSNLYGYAMPLTATPLRRALDDAGQYFSRTDAKGPWSTTPGSTGGTDLSCRQSYSILMTDGYWNGDEAGTSGARSNNDGTGGPTITGPNSQSYTYSATSPFTDGYSNTLADVAMYYWKRDLNTSIANEVPTNYRDPAFWQHMVTFGVGLGVSGSVNPTTAFAAIDSGASVTWPNPTSSNAALLDDLLHASVNGRGGFFSAADPKEFATALTDVLNDIVKRTGSASNVAANSTSISSGSQVFQAKFESGKWNGDLEAKPISTTGVGSTPNWRASEKIPAPSTRKIFTKSSGVATAFQWSGLSAADRASVGSADAVDYLRGVRSKELQNGGVFRSRASNNILGDIVHSSPYYVKESNTVYVGANDGMLHAFDAQSGVELFAYVPSAVIPKLKFLTEPSYVHKYFVDGDISVSTKAQTPGKNYLVATLGRGGKGLFGLDVSTPGVFDTTHIRWEYFNATDNDLGYMLGQPVIAKMNNDKWAVIVGNGYNSTSGKAVLYIFDLETGNLIKKIDTAVAGDNGISSPGLIDSDGNGTVDFIYAGDLKGNVWKFDVSNATATNWKVAFTSPTFSPQPLFIAKDKFGTPQPITSPIIISRNDVTSDPNFGKRFILFGSGSYFRSADPTDTQVMSWYGLIDDESASGLTYTTPVIPDRSSLKQRGISKEGLFGGKSVRTFSAGTTGDMSSAKGWYIDFDTQPGERIVTSSTLIQARKPTLLVSSVIPVVDPCIPGGKGYVNAISPFTGAALDVGFFDINRNGNFKDDMLNGGFVGGFDLGIGMPSKPILIGDRVVVGGSKGEIADPLVDLGAPPVKGRISWREIIKD